MLQPSGKESNVTQKRVVCLLGTKRCRREFENDRKCRKETKERRKAREGWKHSSGSEYVPEILNVCVPCVYKSESGSVLQGRCFLQCNLSLVECVNHIRLSSSPRLTQYPTVNKLPPPVLVERQVGEAPSALLLCLRVCTCVCACVRLIPRG